MNVIVSYQPSFALAQITLAANEAVVAEAGAMVSMSSNIAIKTSSTSAGGGLFKALKRSVLTGESFFLNTYTAQGGAGEITFAPTLPGDIAAVSLSGPALIIQRTSYLASSPGVTLDTQFGGLKSLLGGEGLFWLRASGSGEVLITSFGALHQISLAGPYIVDSGHIVAFEETLSYEVKRVGSWKSTLLSGEGLVSHFNGKGRLWLQTRNAATFGRLLGSKLPPRQA